ncbi:MAG: outer membrane protein assembly factor BamB [SAR86 cluster bacterium]|uniref:Outer membrane protein assembly factor BamB n=1 Tax=SAR86 cluster bacterium TaxID=2030880 RepID=A0A2A5AVG5_9GAMM|nr:MAG: outer membrane protein assembly factor BamB [SAR86 cluster bacterium]
MTISRRRRSTFQTPLMNLRSSIRLVVLTALVLSLSSCAGFEIGKLNPLSWFGDDEVNPPAELVAIEQEVELIRQWSVNIGNGQGANYTEITPVLDGGLIFAASENGNIAAIEASSGDVIWRTRLDSPITGGVGAGEGLVMVGTEDAEIVVLDESTGEIKWAHAVSSEVLSPPQTNGDVVIAQTVDGKLLALDFSSGEQRWIYETTLPALTLRGTSTPVITPGGDVIAGFSNGTLIAVSADAGVLRWEERVAVPEGQYDIDRVIDVDGDLLLDGARVLASSYQGNLMAFDISTGRIVWGREASSYHGLEQGFGNIYYCDDKSYVTAIRDNTDDMVWENTDLEYREITAPTSISNFIAVADFEGYVHLLSQIDGRIVGRIQADKDGVRSNLLSANGRLYVYGNSGRLISYSIQ